MMILCYSFNVKSLPCVLHEWGDKEEEKISHSKLVAAALNDKQSFLSMQTK